MVRGAWCVGRGAWCVVRGVWCVVVRVAWWAAPTPATLVTSPPLPPLPSPPLTSPHHHPQELEDKDLRMAMCSVPKRSVVAFEDVDALFDNHRDRGQGTCNVTFSGLLNALDGVRRRYVYRPVCSVVAVDAPRY